MNVVVPKKMYFCSTLYSIQFLFVLCIRAYNYFFLLYRGQEGESWGDMFIDGIDDVIAGNGNDAAGNSQAAAGVVRPQQMLQPTQGNVGGGQLHLQ